MELIKDMEIAIDVHMIVKIAIFVIKFIILKMINYTKNLIINKNMKIFNVIINVFNVLNKINILI